MDMSHSPTDDDSAGTVPRSELIVAIGDRVLDPTDQQWRTVTCIEGESVFMEDGGVMGLDECRRTYILLPSEAIPARIAEGDRVVTAEGLGTITGLPSEWPWQYGIKTDAGDTLHAHRGQFVREEHAEIASDVVRKLHIINVPLDCPLPVSRPSIQRTQRIGGNLIIWTTERAS